MSDPDIRWQQRLQSFRKAYGQLLNVTALAVGRELSYVERLGLIQAFEFTHELAWNTLKDFLESRGVSGLYGSRDVTREAFAKGLIEDGKLWMEMIASRNQTSHLYHEETADRIADAITSYYMAAFKSFLQKLSAFEKEAP